VTRNVESILADQQDYYRARAAEYDEWWLRKGRFDHGAELNARWFSEADEVAQALDGLHPCGKILELACGTGNWTQRLAGFATELTAVDGAPEMLRINEARLKPHSIRYIKSNIFEWEPTGEFDFVFFGFWLSHVPPERFEDFWRLVRACLAPGGKVFLIDSIPDPTSTASNQPLPSGEAKTMKRLLNDGREYEIYKIFYEPADLSQRLQGLGWRAGLRRTKNYFLYGSATPQ
jgi:2-polyprenyl-3-methyl-5-hydroxy-6-metoxy-1,4-benzoquinol methylase